MENEDYMYFDVEYQIHNISMEIRCVYVKKITVNFGSIAVPFGKQERTGQEQDFFLDLSWAITCTLYV